MAAIPSEKSDLPLHVHFIGIAGRAMRGVAAATSRLSVLVTGSDMPVYGDGFEWLANRGIQASEGFSESALDSKPDLAVIGSAWGRGNIEVEAVLDRRLRYRSMPAYLSEYFLEGSRNLIVAGSKGKTTTTAMGAWIMRFAGLDPGYLVGGPTRNLPNEAEFGGKACHVIEGDDYSTLWWDHNPKFCYYHPEVVALTNVLDDHPEHHTSEAGSIRHFRSLVTQLPRSGLLVLGHEGRMTKQVCENAPCQSLRVGFDTAADVQIRDCKQSSSGMEFVLDGTAFSVPLPGRHIAINAALAAVSARHFGVPLETAALALREFKGVGGRFEHLGSVDGIDFYSDFGSLPECIGHMVDALRHQYLGRRIVILFQPFVVDCLPQSLPDLLTTLSSSDRVLVADVYQPRFISTANNFFSDEVFGELDSLGVQVTRVGAIRPSMPEVAAELLPGDVVLGIVHPRNNVELKEFITKLARDAS